MPRLEEIIALCTVIERKSFTSAAEVLGITQPAVSQQIKRLEEEYGSRLLHREGLEVVPTEEGRIVYEYATQIVGLYAKSREAIRENLKDLTGTLSVGASSGLGGSLLPAALRHFKDENPRVRIRMDVADSNEILDRVLQQRLDLGFVGTRRRDRHLTFEPFIQDRLVLVVSPEHGFARRRSISLEEFLEAPLVLQQPGSGASTALRAALRNQNLRLKDLNVVMEAGLQESTKSAVRLGIGGTVISRLGVLQDLESQALIEVEIEGLTLAHDFYSVCRRDQPLPRNARIFLKTARSVAAVIGRTL